MEINQKQFLENLKKKIKSNDVNYKLSESYNLPFKDIYKLNFPNEPNVFQNIHTKYNRFYFYNRFKKIRCTVDVDLKIINVKNKIVKHFQDIIIEFKCEKKIIISDVIKNANYNTRCSKYCIGIDFHNLCYEKY